MKMQLHNYYILLLQFLKSGPHNSAVDVAGNNQSLQQWKDLCYSMTIEAFLINMCGVVGAVFKVKAVINF